jgi:hypothetical protein
MLKMRKQIDQELLTSLNPLSALTIEFPYTDQPEHTQIYDYKTGS